MIPLKFPIQYHGGGKVGALHWEFAEQLLRQTGLFDIQKVQFLRSDWPQFIVNDRKVTFDYFDFLGLNANHQKTDVCFKTQLTDDTEKPGVYAWSQISFPNLTNIPKVNYRANTDIILNNQRPYGHAVERREKVQKLLRSRYEDKVDMRHDYPQSKFFDLVNNCLTYVHVPGHSNNMIDRAHVQMFALGCCMITTHIPTIFPNGLRPIAGTHYVKCADDYSDLVECIEYVRSNREEALHIGQNAAQLFQDTLSLPAFRKHLINTLEL